MVVFVGLDLEDEWQLHSGFFLEKENFTLHKFSFQMSLGTFFQQFTSFQVLKIAPIVFIFANPKPKIVDSYIAYLNKISSLVRFCSLYVSPTISAWRHQCRDLPPSSFSLSFSFPFSSTKFARWRSSATTTTIFADRHSMLLKLRQRLTTTSISFNW